MHRVIQDEIRRVAGFDVVVKTCENMDYLGHWNQDEYKCYLGGKEIGSWYGWPSNEVIKECIYKETKSVK